MTRRLALALVVCVAIGAAGGYSAGTLAVDLATVPAHIAHLKWRMQ